MKNLFILSGTYPNIYCKFYCFYRSFLRAVEIKIELSQTEAFFRKIESIQT